MTDLETISQNGGVAILPIETVYELFTQAMNENIVERAYQLKRRLRNKMMNLNVADFETILAFPKQQPGYLKKLYGASSPSPLAIALQANDRVPVWTNPGLSAIGFRIPSRSQTLKLIKKVGPLIGPSANIFGQESGKAFKGIQKQSGGTVTDFADDATLIGVGSITLDLSGETARILRQGAITQNDLLAVVFGLTFMKERFLRNSSHTVSVLAPSWSS